MNDDPVMGWIAMLCMIGLIVIALERAGSANAWRREAIQTGNARWVLDPMTGKSKWEWIDHAAPATQPSPEASTK